MIDRHWRWAIRIRYHHDSRLVLWTWRRLHQKTRLEWARQTTE